MTGKLRMAVFRLEDYKKERLREAIGYVPQDHFLFSTTVANNIAFSNEHASAEQVERAAKIAHIHEDIMRFSEGYDTVVGERGVCAFWWTKTAYIDCSSTNDGTEFAYFR